MLPVLRFSDTSRELRLRELLRAVPQEIRGEEGGSRTGHGINTFVEFGEGFKIAARRHAVRKVNQ